MAIISGYGQLALRSTDLENSAIAQNLLLAADNLAGFTITTNTPESRKARAWRNCKQVIVGSAPGEEERTLAIQIASVDWAAVQLGEGELAANTNVTLPMWKTATVPLTAPYEIADTDITAASAASTTAYLIDKIGSHLGGYLSRVSAAPASAREVQVDGAGNRLVLHPDLAGGGVAYLVDVAQSSIPSIGVTPDPIKISEMSFIGHYCGDGFDTGGMIVYCPKIVRTSRPTYNTADDVPTLEINFDCLVPAGGRESVQFFNLAA